MFVVQYQLRSCRGAALEIRDQMKDNEFCAASRLFPWRFFPPIGVWDRTVGPSWEVMTRLVIIDGHRWTEMGAGPSLARSCEASHSPLEADLHLSASPHMVSKWCGHPALKKKYTRQRENPYQWLQMEVLSWNVLELNRALPIAMFDLQWAVGRLKHRPVATWPLDSARIFPGGPVEETFWH